MKLKNRIVTMLVIFASMHGFSMQDCDCENQNGTKPSDPKRLSFYEVPLVCPAAPHIGCGSASKPLLLGLERNKTVSGAWLNRAGTILAVAWSEGSKPRQRSKTVEPLFKEREIEAKELTGEARRCALKDFQGGTAWYRGAEVDRLSEEEAGIMAGRLIKKIRSVVTVTDQNAGILQESFSKILARRLTGELLDRKAAEAEILKVCQQYLNEQEIGRLQEALKDFRPNRDEP